MKKKIQIKYRRLSEWEESIGFITTPEQSKTPQFFEIVDGEASIELTELPAGISIEQAEAQAKAIEKYWKARMNLFRSLEISNS